MLARLALALSLVFACASVQAQAYPSKPIRLVAAALTKQGVVTAGTSPQQFEGILRDEHKKWGDVIRRAGIKLN